MATPRKRPEDKKRTGRPSAYSEEVADLICERLACGESLKRICSDEGMPAQSSVFKWLGENPSFSEKYVRAREAQAEALADEIVDIADGGSADPQRDRLRVEARKWIASKLKPKKYGDKQSFEMSGPEGGPIVQVTRIELVAPSLDDRKD